MNVNVDLMEKNVIQINGGITINIEVTVKKIMYVKKNYVWNPATCNCENGKYLASVMDKVIFNEIIAGKETSFNEKNITCKIQSSYILITFLLITIALLTAISI